MSGFEYKVVPAPKRGLKAKGIKGSEARFANALQTVMNELGAEGWEYQRTDTLPLEERQGLTGKATSFQNMLIFRRALTMQTVDDVPLIQDQSEEQPQDTQEERVSETLAQTAPVALNVDDATAPAEEATTPDAEEDGPRHAAE